MNASSNKGDLLPRVKRMLNKQEKTTAIETRFFTDTYYNHVEHRGLASTRYKNTTPRLYSNGTVKK